MPELPECAGCGEPIEVNEPCYALQSGYIDEDGKVIIPPQEPQLFHTGKCLNSEDY